MMTGSWSIRPAKAEDAAALAALMNELNRHEGLEPFYDEARVLRDGFGEDAAYTALIADGASGAFGYAAYHTAYDTERGGHSLWLLDLYVAPMGRGRGAGLALMARVAKAAQERNCVSLWWGVRSCNEQARAFYAELGAIDDDERILELAGPALAELASQAG